MALSMGDVVAFLDDDAVADERWLEELIRPLDDPLVIGTGGGAALPRWEAGEPPRFIPPEFYWVVGCSYLGEPLLRRTYPEPNRGEHGLQTLRT